MACLLIIVIMDLFVLVIYCVCFVPPIIYSIFFYGILGIIRFFQIVIETHIYYIYSLVLILLNEGAISCAMLMEHLLYSCPFV